MGNVQINSLRSEHHTPRGLQFSKHFENNNGYTPDLINGLVNSKGEHYVNALIHNGLLIVSYFGAQS